MAVLMGVPQLDRSSDEWKWFSKSSSPIPEEDISYVPPVFRDVYISLRPSTRDIQLMSVAWKNVLPPKMRPLVPKIASFIDKITDSPDPLFKELFSSYGCKGDSRPLFILNRREETVRKIITLYENCWGNPYLELLKKMPPLLNRETMSPRWNSTVHVPEEMKHWFYKDADGFYRFVSCPFLDVVYNIELLLND